MPLSNKQQIIDAFDALLKTILVAGGYNTDLGLNVYERIAKPLQISALPAVVYSEESGTTQDAFAEDRHLMPVSCEIIVPGATVPKDLRAAEADIIKAVGSDRTLGGLAQDIRMIGIEVMEIDQKAEIVGARKVNLVIDFTTEIMNPYQ